MQLVMWSSPKVRDARHVTSHWASKFNNKPNSIGLPVTTCCRYNLTSPTTFVSARLAAISNITAARSQALLWLPPTHSYIMSTASVHSRHIVELLQDPTCPCAHTFQWEQHQAWRVQGSSGLQVISKQILSSALQSGQLQFAQHFRVFTGSVDWWWNFQFGQDRFLQSKKSLETRWLHWKQLYKRLASNPLALCLWCHWFSSCYSIAPFLSLFSWQFKTSGK